MIHNDGLGLPVGALNRMPAQSLLNALLFIFARPRLPQGYGVYKVLAAFTFSILV